MLQASGRRDQTGRLSRIVIALCLLLPVGYAAATAQDLLEPGTQPRFVNPLPVPGAMQPTEPGGTHYEIAISQFRQSLGLRDPITGEPMTTTVWGYNGTYPGATIEARRDVPITVHWTNDLVDEFSVPLPHLLPVDTSIHWAAPESWPYGGVPVVTHLHGGHSESASDGLPEAWFTPGFTETGGDWVHEVFRYDNDQQTATLWYHDHALGITRLNVYAGLAGYYLLRDDWEDNLGLPSGPYEIPIAIQDRMFTSDGQLFYPSEPEVEGAPNPSVLPEFFGDFILVNGMAWPRLDVEPRKYRFRLLNGSDSRFYNMWISPEGSDLDSSPRFVQIGTDDGLLNSPVRLPRLLLAPGERADVVVDFSDFAGATLILRNNARSPFPKGETVDPSSTGLLMAFVVGNDPVHDPSIVPDQLRQAPIEPLVPNAPERELLLFEGEDEYGRLKPMLGTAIDGAMEWDDPITEDPQLYDTEVWSIHNATPDAHPIHLHLVSFQILDRQRFRAEVDPETGALMNIRRIGRPVAPGREEAGWKDTAVMPPGQVTRVIATFDRPGLYVWHCHILSHEDHEMMRPYRILESVPRQPEVDVALLPVLPAAVPRYLSPGASIDVRAGSPGAVGLSLYDLQGRLVRSIAGMADPAGSFRMSWDGRGATGRILPAGAYFYRVRTAQGSESGKVIVLGR